MSTFSEKKREHPWRAKITTSTSLWNNTSPSPNQSPLSTTDSIHLQLCSSKWTPFSQAPHWCLTECNSSQQLVCPHYFCSWYFGPDSESLYDSRSRLWFASWLLILVCGHSKWLCKCMQISDMRCISVFEKVQISFLNLVLQLYYYNFILNFQ